MRDGQVGVLPAGVGAADGEVSSWGITTEHAESEKCG